MNVLERRRFKRYAIYHPLEFKMDNDEPRIGSITLNLSEAGALISAKSEICPQERVIIRIDLARHEFFLRSRVIHVQNEMDEELHNFGIELLDTNPYFAQCFYREIESLMLYQRLYAEEAGKEVSLAEASLKWYRTPYPWM